VTRATNVTYRHLITSSTIVLTLALASCAVGGREGEDCSLEAPLSESIPPGRTVTRDVSVLVECDTNGRCVAFPHGNRGSFMGALDHGGRWWLAAADDKWSAAAVRAYGPGRHTTSAEFTIVDQTTLIANWERVETPLRYEGVSRLCI